LRSRRTRGTESRKAMVTILAPIMLVLLTKRTRGTESRKAMVTDQTSP